MHSRHPCMHAMHEYLKTAPFDIYELHLFHLVAQHGSFTKAAEVAGLTQSAVTRQVQGIERRLGVPLFERTTRRVELTPAGEVLWRESVRLLGDISDTLQTIREQFADARRVIRVGVSRSVGLAYLPGFFHASLRRVPRTGYRVSYQSSGDILSALESNTLDLGVLCPPRRLPRTLRVTHRFEDTFTLIATRTGSSGFDGTSATPAERQAWLQSQTWLLPDEASNTGRQLRAWMEAQGLFVDPGMQLDSFDLIISLVALGMGVAFVPVRALANFPRKAALVRIPWPERFTRELVVVVRRHRQLPEHLQQFIDNILF